MKFNFFKWFSKNEKMYLANCGHECIKKDKVSAFGVTIITEVPLVNGKIEYCHKCLEKMAIRCAWCEKPIFVGDFITLYNVNSNYQIPKFSVIYNKEPLQLVGCQRSNCADTGADYCGRWMPPGNVERQQSAIEMSFSNPGDIIIGNNDNGKINLEVIKHREMEEE